MRLLQALQKSALLYHEARGIHTSGLADGERLLLVAQDVGRHNTIDRLWGKCLLHGQSPADLILLSTGRISSEMLNKAAKMRSDRCQPYVAHRPLDRAARAWNVTLIGYVRGDSLRVYSAAAPATAGPGRPAHSRLGRPRRCPGQRTIAVTFHEKGTVVYGIQRSAQLSGLVPRTAQ
ncbi:MAG: formate dehydrogenase accessory sulfurtransferase FdhD [Anaerolineae bacterium]|nr:MAG: formate dehydrogenase accessory sulfurtransferase FdhD [Anaerolineae bacterium]